MPKYPPQAKKTNHKSYQKSIKTSCPIRLPHKQTPPTPPPPSPQTPPTLPQPLIPHLGPRGTSSNPGKEKLSFAERHKAPTTKDVETNNWVFGGQQAVSGPGDRSADTAGTDLSGVESAGDGGGLAAGTAAANTGLDRTGTGAQGVGDDGVAGTDGDETGGEEENESLKEGY
jgi:hypothetical protein